MSETILVAGTASHVGKSTVAAGLCRRLAAQGLSVTPFKAQNMSNNARAVPTPDGEWGEIGVSQYVQARAAGTTATTDANPVLLKPRGDGESQVVIDGRAVGHYAAATYYAEHWSDARAAAVAAHERLAAEHDVIVAEGAGSIAEINLHDRDLANVEVARFADASILLVTDIERGGAFASLVGTLELMPADLRERVCGVVINKFRGDRSLLEPGIDAVERRCGLTVLDVVAHEDPGLPAEDSVSLPPPGEAKTIGGDDGVPADRSVTVAAPRLPRISNFTDLEPLAREPGVRVSYRPIEAPLAGADAVVLPGTKNTVDDLAALRAAGFEEALLDFDGPIVGLCGGYQMLGERITNAAVEGTGDRETIAGLGLLPVVTEFTRDKRVETVSVPVAGAGPIDGASGTAEGYEIHMGRTTATGPVEQPLGDRSAARGAVLGTYLHGLFENDGVRRAFLRGLPGSPPCDSQSAQARADPHDAAAELVRGIELDSLLSGAVLQAGECGR